MFVHISDLYWAKFRPELQPQYRTHSDQLFGVDNTLARDESFEMLSRPLTNISKNPYAIHMQSVSLL